MPRVVEFYFDYGSPYSYIAHTRLREVLRRTGGEAQYRIMLLGGVFQLTGNSSPANNPLKWPNSQRDLERYVKNGEHAEGDARRDRRRIPGHPAALHRCGLRGHVARRAEDG